MSKVMPLAGAGKEELTLNLNVVVPLLPSFAETSLMLKRAMSSFRIFPTPWPSATVAPEMFATFTKNLSVRRECKRRHAGRTERNLLRKSRQRFRRNHRRWPGGGN